jgi:hypothetical protein
MSFDNTLTAAVNSYVVADKAFRGWILATLRSQLEARKTSGEIQSSVLPAPDGTWRFVCELLDMTMQMDEVIEKQNKKIEKLESSAEETQGRLDVDNMRFNQYDKYVTKLEREVRDLKKQLQAEKEQNGSSKSWNG